MLLPRLHYAVGKTHAHIPLPQQPDTKMTSHEKSTAVGFHGMAQSHASLPTCASVTTVVETVVAEPLTAS